MESVKNISNKDTVLWSFDPRIIKQVYKSHLTFNKMSDIMMYLYFNNNFR